MKQLSRSKTRTIKLGDIYIGGSSNVLIQSMCNIKTEHYEKVSEQINRCASLGADLMRVSILDEKDAEAIKEIKKRISIPLVADIHFDHRLALAAIASGVDAIRINPGNIKKEYLKCVIDECKSHNTVLRIGVNSGSLEKGLDNNKSIVKASSLVKSALQMVSLLESYEFYNIVISLKGSDVCETIKAYEMISRKTSYPLHLGITEAGPKDVGLIRSTAGLAPLLINELGDTIRISLSDEPEEEIKACRRLLKDLHIRNDYPTLISCPTCGRTMVNLVPLAKAINKYLEEHNITKTIAIMGCIVNGPGEARHADLGAAGGNGEWAIFKKDKIIDRVSDEKIYDRLIEEINNL